MAIASIYDLSLTEKEQEALRQLIELTQKSFRLIHKFNSAPIYNEVIYNDLLIKVYTNAVIVIKDAYELESKNDQEGINQSVDYSEYINMALNSYKLVRNKERCQEFLEDLYNVVFYGNAVCSKVYHTNYEPLVICNKQLAEFNRDLNFALLLARQQK